MQIFVTGVEPGTVALEVLPSSTVEQLKRLVEVRGIGSISICCHMLLPKDNLVRACLGGVACRSSRLAPACSCAPRKHSSSTSLHELDASPVPCPTADARLVCFVKPPLASGRAAVRQLPSLPRCAAF